MNRTQLEKAAEAAYRQEKAREAKFRAFMCSHLGLLPGTTNDQVEAMICADDPKELTDEQLRLLLHFDLGLPPGYSFTEEQLDVAIDARHPEIKAKMDLEKKLERNRQVETSSRDLESYGRKHDRPELIEAAERNRARFLEPL